MSGGGSGQFAGRPSAQGQSTLALHILPLLYTNNAVSARTNVTTRRWRSPRRVAPPLITVTTVTVAAITTGWETSQGERELGNKVR